MILCTLFTSSAQIIYKFGLNQTELSLTALLLAAGIISYGIGAVLLLIALKGGELSVLYPIIALSYALVIIGSKAFFGETITLLKWVGVIVIIVGISLIGYGGNHK